MIERELGRTGIKLPVIGLGTWQYRGGIEPLQTGVALGACFIDTAESYGTEEVVGQAIRGARQKVFLATKVAPRHFRYFELIQSANESLRRLKTDYIDLYQLHWPNYTVPIEETMGAMEELVDVGKVRFIGVSNFMLRDLEKAQRALTKHRIVSNQVRYNLIDRTIEPCLLRYCQEHDIGVIAHSPLATNLANIQKGDPENVLGQLAEATGGTPAQVAIQWCCSKPGVVTIPKANLEQHVRENSVACDIPLSSEQLQLLDRKVRFRRRSSLEIEMRRIARHMLQLVGKNQ
jgi:diketogulonate reductase-like aldo/keto reductase